MCLLWDLLSVPPTAKRAACKTDTPLSCSFHAIVSTAAAVVSCLPLFYLQNQRGSDLGRRGRSRVELASPPGGVQCAMGALDLPQSTAAVVYPNAYSCKSGVAHSRILHLSPDALYLCADIMMISFLFFFSPTAGLCTHLSFLPGGDGVLRAVQHLARPL